MKREIIVLLMVLVAGILALPKNKRESNEESRLSNEILPVLEVQDETSQEVITASVPEVSTTAKVPALDDVPTPKSGNNRQKNKQKGSSVSQTFSRVFDDIFNIPISVLRAVNTLLNNAFGNRSSSSSTSASSS